MQNDTDNKAESVPEPTIRERISGAGQVLLGEIETIGGVLTGDPVTRAEGDFNVEVGTVREQAEHDLENADKAAGDSEASQR